MSASGAPFHAGCQSSPGPHPSCSLLCPPPLNPSPHQGGLLEAEKLLAAAPSLDSAVLTAKLGVAAAALKVAADVFSALPDLAKFAAIWVGLAAAVFVLPRAAAAVGKARAAPAVASAPAPAVESAAEDTPAAAAAGAAGGEAAELGPASAEEPNVRS